MKIKNLYLFIFIFLVLFTTSCKKEQYEVTFDSNGGTVINSIMVNEEESVTRPSNPEKEGYDFSGWYLNDELYDFNNPVTSNIKLTAKWNVKTYKVSFIVNNDIYKEIKVNHNEKISTIENPIVGGGDFLGWYLNGELFDFNSPILGDTLITAKFVKTFDAQLIVGNHTACIEEANDKYLFLVVDHNYEGYVEVVDGKDSYKVSIDNITSNMGKLVITYKVNNAYKELYVENIDSKFFVSGISSGKYELTVPNTVEITYHLHDNTIYKETIFKNSFFTNYNYDMSNTDGLVLDGWYLENGTKLNEKNIIKENIELFANVYTDGLIFDMNEVIFYDGDNKKVYVPKYFDGYLIDTIDGYAFIECMIEEVYLPESIKVIGESAFEGCIILNKVVALEGLEEIEEKAFYLCNSLTKFDIPSSVILIGDFSFSFTNIENVVFPEGLIYLGDYAYHACNNLETVEFLSSIPCEIGSTVFTCTNEDFENLEIYYSNIPIYVPDQDDNPYKEYRKHINLRDYASSIYPASVKGQTGYIVRDNVLLGHINDTDETLTYLDVPSGVEEIDDFAFYGNIRIEIIDMKEGFIKIGEYAFYNCTSVKYLYMPSTLEEIDDYAFTGFFVGNYISRLYFPEGFKRIGEGAFLSCYNLRTIEFPSTLEYIGYLAFGMGNSLENVYFNSVTPPEVGIYTNDVDESFKDIFEIINVSTTTFYVPYGNHNGEKIVDIYKKADGFIAFADYIKAKPEGKEVGHYGNGSLFIDLDGCDTATIYEIVECENDTTELGGSRYEYKKYEGTYVLNGFRLQMTFPNYGTIIAIYGNREINFTYDGYNWTNFTLYESEANKGFGIFDMYGSFLTPFEWEIIGDVFKIRIDGNNKLPENADYAGVKEYVGTYDKTTKTFKVSFMLNDYYQIMNFTASIHEVVYATGEATRLNGTYIAYAPNNPDYAMFTLISMGTGLVDVYIGENIYEDCSYTLIDNVLTIDVQSFVVTVNMTKDGFISGNFMGVDVTFVYVDPLHDSTKIPSRDDIE